MPFTRQQAEALLNKTEMALFNDSRVNELRKLSAAEIDKRITRARAVRDRARDLVQRQKLASRKTTGNKRGTSGVANERSKQKVELTADILKRFEGQLKIAKKKEKEAAPPKGRKAPAKVAAKKAAAKKVASKKSPAASRRASAADLRRISKISDPTKAKKKAATTKRAKKADTIGVA